MADWNVAEAKRRLSEVLRSAATEPQRIRNRERLVAAVIGAEEFASFEAWRSSVKTTVAEEFEELRRLAEAESWSLEVPRRRNRSDGFARARRAR